MKTTYFNDKTIVAFHIGRGGHFHNAGHLTFIGEKGIGAFIDNLFWDSDESGNPILDSELRTEAGSAVGCTMAEVKTGIGRIDIDGLYDTTYTMKLSDVEQDSKEWVAIFEAYGFDAEQAQIFLRPELAIETLEELAEYINNKDEWTLAVNDIIEANDWEDETGEQYGVCSDGSHRVYLTSDGIAEIAEIE